MTRKQVVNGILVNVAFWSAVGLVVVTNGWAFFGAILLLVVFALFALGAGMTGG